MGQRTGAMVNESVWLYPGQGAQRVGMGRDLAARFPAAREVFDAVEHALEAPLTRIMWEGPEDELTQTHHAQPAILAHSAAVVAVLRLHGVGLPVAAAGHSLGEYSALVAVDALPAPEAAALVRRRGQLMLAAGQARPGTMAAVLGLPTAAVEAACGEASSGSEVVVPANLNAPDQTVVSGDPAAVDRAGALCKARGAKRVISLKVSGAFHSPLMEPAQEPLAEALAAAPFRDPAVPVLANASAQRVTTAAGARAALAAQLTAPVRWVACIEAAAHLAGEAARWIEMGPGTVLAGLAKRIVPSANTLSLSTADDVTRFLEAAA